MNAARCVRQCWPLAGIAALVLLGANLAFGQNLQPNVQIHIEPGEGLPIKLDQAKLKQAKEQVKEAAKKVQEAADKDDMEALEAALRDLDKLLRGLRVQPAGGIVPRVIINGQEVKPGDPNFPRIRIIPPAQPQPPQPPQDKKDKEQGKNENTSARNAGCREGYGTIWYLNLDEALKEAQKTGKPVFVFHTLGDLFDKL